MQEISNFTWSATLTFDLSSLHSAQYTFSPCCTFSATYQIKTSVEPNEPTELSHLRMKMTSQRVKLTKIRRVDHVCVCVVCARVVYWSVRFRRNGSQRCYWFLCCKKPFRMNSFIVARPSARPPVSPFGLAWLIRSIWCDAMVWFVNGWLIVHVTAEEFLSGTMYFKASELTWMWSVCKTDAVARETIIIINQTRLNAS